MTIPLFDSIVLIIERLNVRTDERHLKTSEDPTLHYHANPLSVNILHPFTDLLKKQHCRLFLWKMHTRKILHYVKGQCVSFVYKYICINAHPHILTAKTAKTRSTRQESTVLQPWDQLDDVVPQGRGMEYHLFNGHLPFFRR